MRFTIIFVRFGLRAMEDNALAALVANTSAREWGLRVVDNWGNPETLTALWHRVGTEEVNNGADALCFLNSDCWVAPGWDREMFGALAREDGAAVVGPSSNCGPQTAPDEAGLVARLEGGWPDLASLAVVGERCQRLWGGTARDCEVYGHCYAIRAADWSLAWGLEPEIRLGYTLYGSEQSLSRRLRNSGRRVLVAPGAYCYHLGEASGRAATARGVVDLQAEREKGRQLFFGKSHKERQA